MENKLCFSVYGELYVVDLDRMLYFEADDHYTHVYYSSGTHFMIPFGLAKVEAALSNKGRAGDAFLRLGRKYIVNIRRVFHVNAVKHFFFNDTAPTEIYTYYDSLSLHAALPI